MDGRFEDPSINLKKVMFWPSNIVQLFQEFGVKTHFDMDMKIFYFGLDHKNMFLTYLKIVFRVTDHF